MTTKSPIRYNYMVLYIKLFLYKLLLIKLVAEIPILLLKSKHLQWSDELAVKIFLIDGKHLSSREKPAASFD